MAELCAGNAHVMECLEDHRSDDGFGVDCRTQLELVMERRAMDFRLDAPLREARAACDCLDESNVLLLLLCLSSSRRVFAPCHGLWMEMLLRVPSNKMQCQSLKLDK